MGHESEELTSRFSRHIQRETLLGKLTKALSLEAVTYLAKEDGVDVVCVGVRRGRSKPSPTLVVFTEEGYKRLHPTRLNEAKEAA
jgi:hypothetical protein